MLTADICSCLIHWLLARFVIKNQIAGQKAQSSTWLEDPSLLDVSSLHLYRVFKILVFNELKAKDTKFEAPSPAARTSLVDLNLKLE